VLVSMLMLIGVLILGLPRRIPTGVVCHPSVMSPSFLIYHFLPFIHCQWATRWATTELSSQCGQASSAGDLLGTGGAPACGETPSLMRAVGPVWIGLLHGHSPVVSGLEWSAVVLTKDATTG